MNSAIYIISLEIGTHSLFSLFRRLSSFYKNVQEGEWIMPLGLRTATSFLGLNVIKIHWLLYPTFRSIFSKTNIFSDNVF
jgi:hypothetical protein